LHSSLAESAYNSRPNSFPELFETDSVTEVKFSQPSEDNKGQITQGGTNLPNDGIVYLQPDKSLKSIDENVKVLIPDVNGGYHTEHYVTHSYQKGVLTDDKAGFNAYYLSDTEKIDSTTKHTYLAIRGSDGIGLDTLNDWVSNNAMFAVSNKYIPQAKLANKAMKEKIAELKGKAPGAVMDITGHSLGTIVSSQAVVNLSYAELENVGQVVLFDGPDVSRSLEKMEGISAKKIQEAGKHVTYYVNPFDIVSMLNREKPWKDQFGKVNVIVPSKYTGTFDEQSSHDFGAFQIDSSGNPLVASESYHPELLTSGQDLARLEKKFIKNLLGEHYDSDKLGPVLKGALTGDLTRLIATLKACGISVTVNEAKKLYDNFQKDYKAIISKAKKDGLEWDRKNIASFHSRIKSASGSQRILLRTQMLYMATQLAEADVSEKVSATKKHISEAKDTIVEISTSTISSAEIMAMHLGQSEVDALVSDIKMSTVWNDSVETSDYEALDHYKTKMTTFTTNLVTVAQNLTAQDEQLAGDIVTNLS
ncbi:lipase family protein, partial [Streptococcus agalactiae]|nr:lipase family protein [Streptococcus agalactiae]